MLDIFTVIHPAPHLPPLLKLSVWSMYPCLKQKLIFKKEIIIGGNYNWSKKIVTMMDQKYCQIIKVLMYNSKELKLYLIGNGELSNNFEQVIWSYIFIWESTLVIMWKIDWIFRRLKEKLLKTFMKWSNA